MKATNLDISKITLSGVKNLPSGGKMLYLNYGGGISPIYLQSPELDLPFDPTYYPDNENSGKYSVSSSLRGMDEDENVRAFHDKLLELDEFLKEQAIKNSTAWFKKAKMSTDAIDSLYTPMIRPSLDSETGEPNGKYPPKFAFKVVKKDDNWLCSIYDNNKTVFDINKTTDTPTDIEGLLMKGSKVRVVLKCNGIWIANGKFGCTWRAEQIKVKVSDVGRLRQFAIESDDEDDNENVDTRDNLVNDSSSDDDEPQVKELEDKKEDDEEEKEEEPELEEEVKPKKTTRRKLKIKSSD